MELNLTNTPLINFQMAFKLEKLAKHQKLDKGKN